MLATDRVFSIRGNKIASMAIDEESIRFSSKSFNNIEDFNEVWSKRLSLATKVKLMPRLLREETLNKLSRFQ